ncbi:MAG: ABC transporter permease subunit [Spirochaetia bacterium]
MRGRQQVRPGLAAKARIRRRNFALLSMVIPGTLALLIFTYIPMPLGIIIAFKHIRYGNNFLQTVFGSVWTGFKNFEFLFRTPDAWRITKNSIFYNALFIIFGNSAAVTVAIALDGLRARMAGRFYQNVMFLPWFFSWVVISTLVFSFLSVDLGLINKQILPAFGSQPVNWYTEPRYWPFILIFVNLWKYTGYGCVVYFAAIAGINPNYFEASALDGASRWQTIRHIMIPLISYLIIIQVLLAMGRIFFSDFGLFFNVTKNNGALYSWTDVIDTYVYRALTNTQDMGLAAAAGTYQAIVGFVLVLGANLVVRRIDPEKSLF